MDQIARVCVACGGWEHPDDPLCEERFDDEELIHFRCYNSAPAVAWREQRRAEEPAYDRYLRLTTYREPVRCPHCDTMLDMSPRVVGMMGSRLLPVNCTRCHRVTTKRFSFDEPGEAIWMEIEAIRADFVRARRLDSIDERVREVAREYDRFVDPFPCKCGGRFSLATKARCPRCERVVFDSYFNLVDEPLSEEQRERLETPSGGGGGDASQ